MIELREFLLGGLMNIKRLMMNITGKSDHTHRNPLLKSEAAIPHDYPGAADVLNAGSLYAAQHGKDFDADARAEFAAAPQALVDVAKGMSRKGSKPAP